MFAFNKNIRRFVYFILLLSFLPVSVQSAELTVHNRSTYPMAYVTWKNGKNCSQKTIVDPLNPEKLIDLKPTQSSSVTLPSDKLVAIGVIIHGVNDKAPVVCDYILSFALSASTSYMLEYDVRDQRCYGQLYRSTDGAYQMVTSADNEKLEERFPEFGWDQFEPGCVE